MRTHSLFVWEEEVMEFYGSQWYLGMENPDYKSFGYYDWDGIITPPGVVPPYPYVRCEACWTAKHRMNMYYQDVCTECEWTFNDLNRMRW